MNGDDFEIAHSDEALEAYLGGLLGPAEDASSADAMAARDAQPQGRAIGAGHGVDSAPDDTRLDCLHIKSAGIALAVQRSAIVDINPWPVDFIATSAGGSIGGHWLHEGRTVALVDTARVILPPDKAVSLASLATRAHEIILLAAGPWALVSEEASTPFKIDADRIHWRGESGRRPWLAGMVSEPGCALLDAPGLVGLLEATDAMETTA